MSAPQLGVSMIGAATVRADLDVDLIDVNLASNQPSFFAARNVTSMDEAVSIRQDQFVISFRSECLSDAKIISSLTNLQSKAAGMVDLNAFAEDLKRKGYKEETISDIVSDYLLENGTVLGVCKEAMSHATIKNGGRDYKTTVQYHGQMTYQNLTHEFHTPGEQLEFFIPSAKMMENLDYGRLTQDGLYVKGQRPISVRRVTTKNLADSLCNALTLYLETPDAAYTLYEPVSRSSTNTISYCHDAVRAAQGNLLFGLNMVMKTLNLQLEARGGAGPFEALQRAVLAGSEGAESEVVVSNLGAVLGFIAPVNRLSQAVINQARTLSGRVAGAQFMSVTKSKDSSLEFGDQVNGAGEFVQNTATFTARANIYEPNINTNQGRMLSAQKQYARVAIAKQGGMFYNRMKNKAGIVTKAAGPYDKGGVYRADLGGDVAE